jgi:CRISPR-associated protein Csb3
LELADRLWPDAEGWFTKDGREFKIACDGTLSNLVEAVANAQLEHTNSDDPYSSPIKIGAPFRALSVDWWVTDSTGAKDLKVWAGTMESYGIALAMQRAMQNEQFRTDGLFDIGMVVTDAHNPSNKKEPYYFEARRAGNAHARDVGFSTNDLHLTTTAHPAVELLCLVGLQVARPAFTDKARVYDYFTWPIPLHPNLLIAASTGTLAIPGQQGFRFLNWFRTGQKKHKAFRFAIPLASKGE